MQYCVESGAKGPAAAAVCLVCVLSIRIACMAFTMQFQHSSGVTTGGQTVY